MKLDRYITQCPSGEKLISIQPTMSEVANGSPLDVNCLFDMDACYDTFDKDGDGKLSLSEFRVICKALFRNDKGHIYPLSEERARHIFQVFDKNGDGFHRQEEFTFCWNHWIKVVSANF
ncbi:troponin C, skeletal muscle-like [Choristoneura fumiferana]|uniref:troponin C, skeletal muscle-like n=1 Tax=Choristoneura fumiferana TaxID=7141 RepID=UPI003D157A9C